MTHPLFRVAVCALILHTGSALAQTTVTDAWVRGTVPQQQATALFAQITSSKGGALVAASSPQAGVVEVHQMSMAGDVMKMRAVPRLALPAGKAVVLKPSGYHVMLMDLKRPLKVGDVVTVTLTIETADKKLERVEVQAPVRALGEETVHKH